MNNRTCLQCSNSFSELCANKKQCNFHDGLCFACRSCEQKDKIGHAQYIRCLGCDKKVNCYDETYYCIYCNKYLCKLQFININLTGEQVVLKCGHTGLLEHVLDFMHDFCYKCARKVKDGNRYCINLCGLCQQKQHQKKQQQQSKNTSIKVEQTQKSDGKSQNNLSKTIQPLNQDINIYKQKINKLTNNYKKLRNILLNNERDSECSVCLTNFDTSIYCPIMICMKQHLICAKCFYTNLQLVECPFCRQPIDRKVSIVSRQRLKTITLEQILLQIELTQSCVEPKLIISESGAIELTNIQVNEKQKIQYSLQQKNCPNNINPQQQLQKKVNKQIKRQSKRDKQPNQSKKRSGGNSISKEEVPKVKKIKLDFFQQKC